MLAISEIDAGDALATATRFDREWAYRGGQALLWKRRIHVERVHESYLPAFPARPFDRRGLLRVDGRVDSIALSLFATQFALDRHRVRDLRFTRAALRSAEETAALFVGEPGVGKVGFKDLGFATVFGSENGRELLIGARGGALRMTQALPPQRGIGAMLFADFVF